MRYLLAGIVFVCLSASAVLANSASAIEAEMRAEGFEQIATKTTLLGRVIIEALGPHGEWEVVITRWGRVLKEEREFEDENGNGIHDEFEGFDD